MKVLVTGGGTGGHVIPALAVVKVLRAIEPDAQIVYVGSADGIEARLAVEAGLRFESVATGKLRRSSKGVRGLLTVANLRDALRVPLGAVQAWRLVGREHPDVVLSTGGYVCVPTVIAAWARRTPVLTHEQTLTVGLANRIAGRFAQRIAVSWEESLAELRPRLRAKAFVSGNPVRASLFAPNGSRFGLPPGLPCVYVTGGAQGARTVNDAVVARVDHWLEEAVLLHQCGKADLVRMEAARAALAPSLQTRWVVRAFIEDDEIGEAYAAADVVVGRSGAGTVNDLCALGKASVLIPLEPTGGNEQVRNAERLEKVGAAVIVRQVDCTGDALLAAVRPLLVQPAVRRRMGAQALALSRPDATKALLDALLSLRR